METKMKKFFSKLMKDTRGVVMMEYIILGLFAVAVTVAGVHVLGQAYNNGLLAMAQATLGGTNEAVDTVAEGFAAIASNQTKAEAYAEALINAADNATAGPIPYDYSVYAATTTTP